MAGRPRAVTGGAAPYRKGHRAELIVKGALLAAGWIVVRSYASKGPYDLMAIHYGKPPWLIEVKGWSARMTRPEREALIAVADRGGATPVWCHYADGACEWWMLVSVDEKVEIAP